jgi:DNA-binding MarR family transcriptional regulator
MDNLDAEIYKDLYENLWKEKETMLRQTKNTSPGPYPEVELPSAYYPKVSTDNREFLHEILSGMGEDEARRLLNHLNNHIIDKTFSISETIDNAIIEFHVTRE